MSVGVCGGERGCERVENIPSPKKFPGFPSIASKTTDDDATFGQTTFHQVSFKQAKSFKTTFDRQLSSNKQLIKDLCTSLGKFVTHKDSGNS